MRATARLAEAFGEGGGHIVRIDVAIMSRPSIASRVTALEEKVGHKTMQEQFREQAELIDRRFDDSFRSQAELIDRRFDDSFRSQAELIGRLSAANFKDLDGKWDAKVDEQLRPIKSHLGILREGMKIILAKLS